MPPDQGHHEPGHLRWLARSAPALAAVIAVVVAALVLTPRSSPEPLATGDGRGPPATAAPAPPPDGWVPLPAGDLTFSEGSPTAVWTGRDVIVLYAENASDQAGVAGYRIDPAAGQATRIARSPLEWRARPAAAWTGSEIVVVGGVGGRGLRIAGAAYDPATDRWRVIEPPPGFRPGASAYSVTGPAVWTGDRLVIWSAGLAYDPAGDRWDVIEPAPLSSRTDEAVVTGPGGFLVWGGCSSAAAECSEEPDSWRVDGAWYDTASGHWTPVPDAPLSPAPAAVGAAAGDAVHVIAGDRQAAYSPATGSWQPRAPPPGPVPPGCTLTLTDDGLALVGRHLASVYDVAADRWAPLAGEAPGRRDHAAVWTGTELVIAGGVPDGRPLAHRSPGDA